MTCVSETTDSCGAADLAGPSECLECLELLRQIEADLAQLESPAALPRGSVASGFVAAMGVIIAALALAAAVFLLV